MTNRGRDAPPLLLKVAKRPEFIDAGLSRATYLDALSAAMFSDGDVEKVMGENWKRFFAGKLNAARGGPGP